MDFDEVLSLVGDFGRYQKSLLVFLCVPVSLFCTVVIYGHVFISAVPEHHCHLFVTAERANLFNKSLEASEDYHRALRSLFLPREGENFAQCDQYDVDINSLIDQLVIENNGINSSVIDDFVAQNRWPRVQCRNGWDYDSREFTETLATKFDVVCDRQWLVSTAQSAFYFGGIAGSIFLGWHSDKWGRRPALLLSVALMTLGSLGIIFSPTYVVYITWRFIVGLTFPATHSIALLIGLEVIGAPKRMTSSMMLSIAFAFAVMLHAGIAYLFSHWRTLQMVTSLPMLLAVAYYWFVHTTPMLYLFIDRPIRWLKTVLESPRWLISQGRIKEAEVILQRIAKINRVTVPANLLQSDLQLAGVPSEQQGSDKVGMALLWKYPKITMKLFIITAVWTMTSMTYHGLGLVAPELPTNAYFSFFLSGLADIPGTLFIWVTMDRYGRKTLMLGSFASSGVLLSAAAFVPDEMPWLTVFLVTLSKLSISMAYDVMYTFAGELFPTVMRGFAYGVASTMSQIGLVLTPYILFMGTLHGRMVSLIVFGVFSFLTALLIMFPPETLDAPLPTTMQEAEDYDKYVKEKKAARKSSVPVPESGSPPS